MSALTPRAHLRAALLAGVIGCHGLAAVPSPSSLSRDQFRHPVAIEELDNWVELFGAAGVATSRKELIDHLVETGGRAVGVRKAVLAPLQPVFRATGTGQGWGLFAFPDSYPDRLIVEGRRVHEPWEPLYTALHPEQDFLSPQLTHRRVRGVYDGHTDRPGRPYDNFVHWVAREAFAVDAGLTAVRVGFERSHSLPPTAPAAPETTIRLQRVVQREEPE